MQQAFRDGPRLICIAPHLVDKVWPSVVDLIRAALKASESDLTAETIKARIDAGQAYLWIVWRTSLLAAGTTEIVKLENGRKLCVISTCGGRDMASWKHTLALIEDYARMEGCEAVRFYGRMGHVRYFAEQGYAQPWVVVEKAI
jgi:hypothetical protein